MRSPARTCRTRTRIGQSCFPGPTGRWCRPRPSDDARHRGRRRTSATSSRPARSAPPTRSLSSLGLVAGDRDAASQPLSRRAARLAPSARAVGTAQLRTGAEAASHSVERRPRERRVRARQRGALLVERVPGRRPRCAPGHRARREEPRRLDHALLARPRDLEHRAGTAPGRRPGRRAPRRRSGRRRAGCASLGTWATSPCRPQSTSWPTNSWNCAARRIRTGIGPSSYARSWATLGGVVAAGEPVDARRSRPRPSAARPASRPRSCRFRAAVVKNSVAAASSGVGPVERSTMTSAPASASASPSPVITSTPVERAIGTTSWPRASRMSTTWRPARPVAPATAILISNSFVGSSVSHCLDGPRPRDVTAAQERPRSRHDGGFMGRERRDSNPRPPA